jgi:hypothetical protein
MAEPIIVRGGRVVSAPPLAEAEQAFNLYVTAVGRVAYAWNYLHEQFAALFARIIRCDDPRVAIAVWYSSTNDRAQREMLRAAIEASEPDPGWSRLPDTAKDDLRWLLDRTNELGAKRDDAIHAPCELDASMPGSSEMAAMLLSGHRRARNLVGKQLIVEFDWLERYAFALANFTWHVRIAMNPADPTWPERPRAPDRRPKTALLSQPHRLPPI